MPVFSSSVSSLIWSSLGPNLKPANAITWAGSAAFLLNHKFVLTLMPKRPKFASTDDAPDSELNLLAWLATCASVIAFLFYFRNREVMLYGDAIAHINIARRVFDSKTPGLLQLGTVWLPLPHLLMIPFIISQRMWQQGVGGSIPSMAGYVFGVVGIFRFVRGILSRSAEPEGPARVVAWIAASIYGANPNLLYMQSTAMGESLYLAFFVWAIVYFSEWLCSDSKALTKCGLCLIAACLTRYDGWFLAVTMAGIGCIAAISHGRSGKRQDAKSCPRAEVRSSRRFGSGSLVHLQRSHLPQSA